MNAYIDLCAPLNVTTPRYASIHIYILSMRSTTLHITTRHNASIHIYTHLCTALRIGKKTKPEFLRWHHPEDRTKGRRNGGPPEYHPPRTYMVTCRGGRPLALWFYLKVKGI